MITLKEVEKIAHLSKLALSENEKQKFVTELGNILGFVEKLDQLDLKNVAATSHAVEVTNVFRDDKIFMMPVLRNNPSVGIAMLLFVAGCLASHSQDFSFACSANNSDRPWPMRASFC